MPGRKMAWFSTEFTGVRYRHGYFKKDGVEQIKKNGVQPDKYFALHYKMGGKVYDEPLGWASDGWNAESAALKLAELKRNRKEGGPTTLKESKAALEAKRQAEEAERRAKANAEKTLKEYWKDTYFPSAKLAKKEVSWKKEEQHFRIWIEPLLGAMTLQSITLSQWDELIKALATGRTVELKGKAGNKDKEKPKIQKRRLITLTRRSREYITGTLRRILKHALDRGMVVNAPPSGKRVGIPGPGNNRRLRVINYEEEQQITGALKIADPCAWKIVRFAFFTGCRASEAFNLIKANVDQVRGILTFPETKNSDARVLPITPVLEELFEDMVWDEQHAFVFTKEDGSCYKEAPTAFKRVVQDLGLNVGRMKRDRITFHSIRHTVATRLARHLGVRDLMDVMGWRTVQMAMRYVHSNEDQKMKALSALGLVPRKGKVLQFETKL